MKHWFSRTLSVLLVCTLLLQMSVTGFAAAETVEPAAPLTAVTTAPLEAGTASGEAFIVSELTELREESVKYFRRSDGSILAAAYGQPVHYLVDGVYRDIDNTLLQTTENGKAYWKNTAGAVEMLLPQQLGAAPVMVRHKGYTLTLSPTNTALAVGTVQQPPADTAAQTAQLKSQLLQLTAADVQAAKDLCNTVNKNSMNARTLRASVTYAGNKLTPSVHYELNGSALKESILLPTLPATAVYSFTVNAAGLTPTLQADNSVTFADASGNAVFVIPTPYMWDAAGEHSDAIAVTLTPTGKGTYTYTLTPDRTWLADTARVYPVTVDPTIYPSFMGGIKDTYGSSETEYSSDLLSPEQQQTLKIGYRSGDTLSSLIYAPIPAQLFLGNNRVVQATLHLSGMDTAAVAAGGLRVNALRITKNWGVSVSSEESPKFGVDFPTVDTTVLDSVVIAADSTESTCEWDITAAAQQWLDGSVPNYGIALSGVVNTTQNYVKFTDADALSENSSVPPLFLYSYRSAVGLESYWPYLSLSAGDGNVLSVNAFNGNTVLTMPGPSLPGNRMPVSVVFTYNNGGLSGSTKFGSGIQLNYAQTITAVDGTTANTLKYCLLDGDGTRHYFYEDPDNAGTYLDEDGLDHTLTLSGNEFLLTEKGGGKRYFNQNGNLYKLQDLNGNTIQITLNDNDAVTAITDGAGRVYTFTYTNDRLSQITDPNGRDYFYNYTAHDQLSYIEYPDGTYFSLLYSNTEFCGTENFAGQRLELTYYTRPTVGVEVSTLSGKPRVHTLVGKSAYGSNAVTLYDYTFAYSHNATDITDIQGNTVTCLFNHTGTLSGVIDRATCQAVQYTFGEPGISAPKGERNKIKEQSAVQNSVVNLLNNGHFGTDLNGYTASGGTVTRIGTDGHTAPGALQIVKPEGVTDAVAVQTVTAPKTGYYTLSAFVNNSGKPFTTAVPAVELSAGGETLHCAMEPTALDGWHRLTVTLSCEAGQTVTCRVGFIGADSTAAATAVFDDLQLEFGETANAFNLLQNTDFGAGSTAFTAVGTGAVTPLTDAVRPTDYGYRFAAPSVNQNNALFQTVNTAGNAGDVFSVGAWAKGSSLPLPTADDDESERNFAVTVEYFNGTESVGRDEFSFNRAYSGWQFTSGKSIAPAAYTSVKVGLEYNHNLNAVTFTAPYLYKENYGQTYTYDDEGNVVSSVSVTESETSFDYANDRMSKLFSPTGSSYAYTYSGTGNLTNAMSSDGQVITITYDSAGNPLSATTWALTPVTEITDGGEYIFVNAETRNMLDCGNSVWNSRIHNWSYYKDHIYQEWTLTADENGTYSFRVSPTYDGGTKWYMTVIEQSSAETGYPLYTRSGGTAESQRFTVQKNDNGTFTIRATAGNYAGWAVDAQPGTENGGSKNGVGISVFPYTAGDKGQEWYLYEAGMTTQNTLHSSSSATYTADMNYQASITDGRGKTTSYTYTVTGQAQSVTAPNGIQTQYTYDPVTDLLTTVTATDGTTPLAGVEYRYDEYKRLTAMLSGLTTKQEYRFGYDAAGRQTSVAVAQAGGTAQTTLASYEYDAYNRLSRENYGNGTSLYYTYDSAGRLAGESYSATQKGTVYGYTADGGLGVLRDYVNDRAMRYTYDLSGRLVGQRLTQGANETGSLVAAVSYKYEDGTDRLLNYTVDTAIADPVTTGFTYGNKDLLQMPDMVYGVTRNDTQEITYTYDRLGRLTSRTLNVPNLATTYTYESNGNATTGLVKTATQNGITTTYYYDSVGNITHIVPSSGDRHIYQYDGLNQLTRASINGVVTDYTYDERGNLLSKTNISTGETDTYTYGNAAWADLLTAYNGQTITYDQIGNPLTYRDGMTMTWQNGRQLATLTKDGVVSAYTYDHNGNRLSKTVGTATTNYYVMDGTLYALRLPNGRTMVFHYDENDTPYAMKFLGKMYYYQYNVQGDVIGIIDSTGNSVVSYTYDAWGNPLSMEGGLAHSVGTYNPFRYRGYIYDTETGFYATGSRYYDPEIGRFINPDITDVLTATPMGLTDKNLFAYCDNNPVVRVDHGGYLWDEIWGWVVDTYNRSMAIQQQQQALDDRIRQEQINMIADGAEALWKAHELNIQLEVETQYRQDMAVKDLIENELNRWKETPVLAGDFAAMTCGNIVTYAGYVSLAAGATVGGVVTTVLGVAVSVWGILRYYEII